MATTPSLLLGVVVALSALHMLAPDHWVPVTVAAHRNGYTRAKTFLLASGIGLAHRVTSVALSLAIVGAGLLLFPTYYVNLFAVALLLIVALYLVVNAAREARAGTKAESVSVLVSVIPDPALVPFIVIAQTFGDAYTYLMLSAFVVATVASAIAVVYVAVMGLTRALSKVRPEHVDYLVAVALVLVAAFIYFAG